jgi:hypothetical protein
LHYLWDKVYEHHQDSSFIIFIAGHFKLFISFFNIAAKNGVYISLVNDVRNAFEGSTLVKIDCRGMHASDYKKLGAKLKVCNISVLLTQVVIM